MFEPAYLSLARSGELKKRAAMALEQMRDCNLCANYCCVDRTVAPAKGRCRTGRNAVVCSIAPPHYGEERPISGTRGSGTIFFGWCNLSCVFCQNWEISHAGEGREMDDTTLANQMLYLQAAGCHNINFVSSSHVIPQILSAVSAATGLKIPLVYNTGGYDSPEGLALLDGVIDIYMPDMKFADSKVASKYVGVQDYAEVNQAAVKEMHRQVGDLLVGGAGVAKRGLLIRHLILPDNLAGTEKILHFIVNDISKETYLNLMEQYRPCYHASRFPGLDRRPVRHEFASARELARELGILRLD